jgi:hypothetical protein
MATWDRLDIAEAHALLEISYNVGGILLERPNNCLRMQSTGWQLHRMGFQAKRDLSLYTLSENAQRIYFERVLEWKLPLDDKGDRDLAEQLFEPEELQASGHPAFSAARQIERVR